MTTPSPAAHPLAQPLSAEQSPTIHIGADHAGFVLKESLITFLRDRGFTVEDHGAYAYDAEDDYPDFVMPVARAVSLDPDKTKGIIAGGSGQGEAICANRLAEVRAVVFNGQYEPDDGREVPHEIEVSRLHNDANVLSLGARFLNEREAKDAVLLWLSTPFSGEERHVRRIKKLSKNPFRI